MKIRISLSQRTKIGIILNKCKPKKNSWIRPFPLKNRTFADCLIDRMKTLKTK